METFAQRANILLGYNPQSSSPTTPSKHPDIDFNDVFGGPPRRSSKQETRFCFTESADSAKNGEDDAVSPRNPWSGHNEMPVFGDESVNRRRYPSDDFFDDIFRGEESLSSPRRSIHDPFGSAPGSRVLSPSRPLPPPRADPLGGSLTAQFQFSLPAKLTKAMDSSVFASANRSSYKYKDPTSNGMSFSYTPSSPLSRLSSETFQGENELKNQFRPSYRPSPLSHEFSLSSKEASSMIKSDELESTNMGDSLNKDLKSTDVTCNVSQFHFSIYKWASKGVPLLMPLRGGNTTKSKERLKIERYSSSNGRIENENLTNGLKTENWCDSDPHLFNHSVSANNKPAYDEDRKQDTGSHLETNPEDRAETSYVVEEAVISKSDSNCTKKFPNIVETVNGHDISSKTIEEIKSHSVSKTGFCKSTEKGSDMHIQVAQKVELKSLKSPFYDTHEAQGNDELTRKSEGKESKVKKKTVSDSNADVYKNVKKRNEKKFNSSRAEVIQVNEPYSQDSRRTSSDNLGRNGVKGKVKEFVKIFNQEAISKPKIDKEPRSQSSRWRSTSTFGADKEGNAKTTETSGKNHVHSMNKMKTPPNTSFTVDKNIKSEKQQSHLKTRAFNASENSFGQKDVSAATSESLPDASKVTVGNIDDLFQENFMIKELSNDQDKLLQMENGCGDIQTSDAKIRQWSKGKEGNIRSLLSTLHYVLWPGSGWKAVPLVDIIEGSAVKRAYQKALLYLHPDKLQQKNAAPHQKYMAEKVFDILQEAWDHFNSLGAI